MHPGKIPHTIYKLSLSMRTKRMGAAEILKSVFTDSGVPLHHIIEEKQQQKICLCTYSQEAKKVDKFKRRLETLHLHNVCIDVQSLKKKEWQDAWKENLRPFAITKSFDVIPTWQKERFSRKRRRPLFIDTTLAFGSGLHETTRFMARLIERCQGQFQSFLDIGTGTGILSIMAFKCGAKKVVAIDVDQESIRVAQRNLNENGCFFAEALIADFENYSRRQRYDFVAANLFTQDLINMRQKMVHAVTPGGFLAVSGIALEHLKVLQASFKIMPLRCLRILKGRKWAAILYKRLNSSKRKGQGIA